MKQSRGTAPPPPLEANDQLVAVIGTVAWAVALVVLLIIRSDLPAGSRWWIWTCVAGLALGLFAVWYVPRLKRSRARAAGRAGDQEQERDRDQEQDQQPDPAGGQSAPRASGSNTVSSTETPGKSTRS